MLESKKRRKNPRPPIQPTGCLFQRQTPAASSDASLGAKAQKVTVSHAPVTVLHRLGAPPLQADPEARGTAAAVLHPALSRDMQSTQACVCNTYRIMLRWVFATPLQPMPFNHSYHADGFPAGMSPESCCSRSREADIVFPCIGSNCFIYSQPGIDGSNQAKLQYILHTKMVIRTAQGSPNKPRQ